MLFSFWFVRIVVCVCCSMCHIHRRCVRWWSVMSSWLSVFIGAMMAMAWRRDVVVILVRTDDETRTCMCGCVRGHCCYYALNVSHSLTLCSLAGLCCPHGCCDVLMVALFIGAGSVLSSLSVIFVSTCNACTHWCDCTALDVTTLLCTVGRTTHA